MPTLREASRLDVTTAVADTARTDEMAAGALQRIADAAEAQARPQQELMAENAGLKEEISVLAAQISDLQGLRAGDLAHLNRGFDAADKLRRQLSARKGAYTKMERERTKLQAQLDAALEKIDGIMDTVPDAVVDVLFKDVGNGATCGRLAMETTRKLDAPGWCRGAVRDQVENALTEAAANPTGARP